MARALVHIVVLAAFFVATTYSVVLERPCRTDVEVVQNFDVERYLGRWYELQRYEQDFEMDLDCAQAQYGLIDADTVSVRNSAYSLLNETASEAIGTAKLSYPQEEILQAKLNVSFFGTPNDVSNYWVIDTDYENYSIVWACVPLDEERSSEGYWLLSRTRSLTGDADINLRIDTLLLKYIEANYVRNTNQLDERCPDF